MKRADWLARVLFFLIALPALQAARAEEAAQAHAWPKLAAARGKMIFVLDDSAAKIKAYQGGRKSLEGRAMFVTGDEASPLTAFLAIPDPQKDAGRIRQAVSGGFMVITRADAETREARDNKTARLLATRAKGRFPVGSPGWVKADDIATYKPADESSRRPN